MPIKPKTWRHLFQGLGASVITVLLAWVLGRFNTQPAMHADAIRTPAPLAPLAHSGGPSGSTAGPEERSSTDRRPAINLTGEWHIENTIARTTYHPFRGLRLGYRVFINQTGQSFTGQGEKCWENDQTVSGRGHTPIRIEGIIRGNQIDATFIEEGIRRKTTGRFEWSASLEPLHLTGNFTSTAASSAGPSIASRMQEVP